MPVSLFIAKRQTPLYAIACCLSLSLGSASADDSIRAQIEALRAAKDSLLKSEDSPLLPAQRARFEQLAYYPIDLSYRPAGRTAHLRPPAHRRNPQYRRHHYRA